MRGIPNYLMGNSPIGYLIRTHLGGAEGWRQPVQSMRMRASFVSLGGRVGLIRANSVLDCILFSVSSLSSDRLVITEKALIYKDFLLLG